MTPQILRDKLIQSAEALGWTTADVPAFTSPDFRGREGSDKPEVPADIFGLRLGFYPVLVAPITLGDVEQMQRNLRRLNAQMVIARSYMRPEEVINAHIMLCATATIELADWRQVVDMAERDETVCRKIVWIPEANALDESYAAFVARTFLATPWQAAGTTLNAPLDHNENLVQRVLVRHGLPRPVADRWVALAEQYGSDPDTLVTELMTARGQS
ncbi:ABC-three component system middle component 1 [Mesorhizobium sp.]|uniref:ABC-three component system middle component 1 n=1 Tax=Mesorhizobium sp. TaxID=1871066 RepID=UPI000FE88039|nr:ABC-three component system middle component 1 [Mesorhizobium sp.]RWL18072.1 MAG: hypothetical protein EOR57_22160 [Mesorhizobium sp.]TIP74368.1 MAG: hypothetical protein E5X55_09200 [Mesorhizobium sp.]TIQ17731.1 MAG: hypothetical protein E5X51_29005 [Mesorhizobium sp.]TJV95463.1 MAG: hypothetical protein E5X52_24140 [Mesorhizobium sp.]